MTNGVSIKWEKIIQEYAGYLERSKTPTGWLVRETQEVMTNDPNRGMTQGHEWRTSITFVPDPHHDWLKE